LKRPFVDADATVLTPHNSSNYYISPKRVVVDINNRNNVLFRQHKATNRQRIATLSTMHSGYNDLGPILVFRSPKPMPRSPGLLARTRFDDKGRYTANSPTHTIPRGSRPLFASHMQASASPLNLLGGYEVRPGGGRGPAGHAPAVPASALGHLLPRQRGVHDPLRTIHKRLMHGGSRSAFRYQRKSAAWS
jgi:hypothetical protein